MLQFFRALWIPAIFMFFLMFFFKNSITKSKTGKDIIGLAETGSGKTGAFALPILQSLLDTPQRVFALVLTPTRFV